MKLNSLQSAATSKEANLSVKSALWQVSGHRVRKATTVSQRADSAQERTEEKLFSALTTMKLFTSAVAMHLRKEWRDQLFRQLDRLHDPLHWEDDEDPVRGPSFRTFLRMMLLLKPEIFPGLSVANGGNITAYWINGRNRLTIECHSDDMIKIVLSRLQGDDRDSAAILTNINRIKDVLAPYDPSIWLRGR